VNDCIRSLGRMRDANSQELLTRFKLHPEASLREQAYLALSRLGVNAWSGDEQPPEGAILLVKALSGSPTDARMILESKNVSAPALLSLAALGCSDSVSVLLAALDDITTAPAASLALFGLTGAPIMEEAAVRDKDDPDGDMHSIQRISQKRSDWEVWIGQHFSSPDPNIKYRRGAPDSPAVLLQFLMDANCPSTLRRLFSEELVIRYVIDIPFETDLFVRDQKKAFVTIGKEIERGSNRFSEGCWYAHGKLVQ
jgi:hypothetical protein